MSQDVSSSSNRHTITVDKDYIINEFISIYGKNIEDIYTGDSNRVKIKGSKEKKRIDSFRSNIQSKVDLLYSSMDISMEISSLIRDKFKFFVKLREWLIDRGIIVIEEEADEDKITIPESMKNLQLVMFQSGDFGDGKNLDARFICYNKVTESISDTAASVYIALCGIKDPAKHAKVLFPAYDPSKPFLYRNTTSDGEEADFINIYKKPKWYQYLDKAKPVLPPNVKVVFNQIIGEMDRKFFIYYLYRMIKARNYVYLILQGDGAIGKTTILEIMSGLVGKANHSTGKNSTFTGTFNSQILNKKLVTFDEMEYEAEDHPVLKEYQNDYISIEAKFQNASTSSKIFCSFVFVNNGKRDNYIPFDARKFAPISLSTNRLDKYITGEEVIEIKEKCSDVPGNDKYDPEYLASIAKWILIQGKKYEPLFPSGEYRGPKFWELCHSSMTRWQRAVTKALTSEEIVWAKQFREGAISSFEWFGPFYAQLTKAKNANKVIKVNFPDDLSAYREFLNIYRDLKGERVFEVLPFDEDKEDFKFKIVGKIRTISEEIKTEDLL